MRRASWGTGLLASSLALALWGGAAHANTTPPGTPLAAQVIVRSKKDLADAMLVALQGSNTGGLEGRPVLVVVDVTPNTERAAPKIREAFSTLAGSAADAASWSVAALGGKPSDAVPTAAELSPLLAVVLAKETDVPSTFTALSKTIRGWRTEGGVVLYLADWRFEDDIDLESVIDRLRDKRTTLSVVGTEAAFGRAWNDGFREGTDRFTDDVRGISTTPYWDGIGRDPFGGKDEKAPWHGGDAAYPLAAYRWDMFLWQTQFSQADWELARLDDETSPGSGARPSARRSR